jgi:hypothetical protein
VGDEIVYPRTLFVGVTLGIFLTFPKAKSKDLVGLCIRHKENLIHETWLVFKHRDDLIVNGFCELSRFSRLGADGDDSSEHNVPPFGSGSVKHNLCLDGLKGQLPKNGARQVGQEVAKNNVLVEPTQNRDVRAEEKVDRQLGLIPDASLRNGD